MRRPLSGFTILELLVVIVVIGILATLSTMSYESLRADSRNSQRNAQAIVIAEALEKYYDNNGDYPTCELLTDTNAANVSTTLAGIDPLVLRTPKAAPTTYNSIQCQPITPTTTSDFIAYVGDGSLECASGGGCLKYVLSYKEEITNDIISIYSRRQTSLAGDLQVVTSGTCNFTTMNLSWNKVANATSYTLQQASSEDMAGSIDTTLTDTEMVATGLSPGQTYYFRVLANPSSGEPYVSPVTYATTSSLLAPEWGIASSTTNSITTNWSMPTCGTGASYTIERSLDSAFSSYTPVTTTALTTTATGLSDDTTYYFRIKAQVGSIASDWSETLPVDTNVACTDVSNKPGNFTANSQGSSSKIKLSWDSLGNATQYEIRYSKSSNITSGNSKTEYASKGSTSKVIDDLATGTKYYFDIRGLAKSPCDNGPRSNTISEATIPAKPRNLAIHVDRPLDGVKQYPGEGWMQGVETYNGNYRYAFGKAKAKCDNNATVKYHFRGEYSANLVTPPGPRYYQNDSYMTRDTWYLISPNPTFGVRFQASALCTNNGEVSEVTNYVKNCAGADGSASCSNWDDWSVESDWHKASLNWPPDK